MYWRYTEEIFLGPQAVSFVERLCSFQNVYHRRFNCTCKHISLHVDVLLYGRVMIAHQLKCTVRTMEMW